MTPTADQITTWLADQQHPETWAEFLTGLPWQIIHPIAKMAGASKVHPALALGMVALHTGDPQVAQAARAHLAAKAPPTATPPPANRAARRARRR